MVHHSEAVDPRPSLFVSTTTETLASVAGEWPRPVEAPEAVHALLAQAPRLFVGATACYDNLVQAVFVALQAAEAALRDKLGSSAPPKATLGQLAKSTSAENVLTAPQLKWYREFAVRWRNMLAHREQPLAVTPGMAEQLVHGVHLLLGEMYPSDEPAP